jgi:hypothetical protein
MHGRRTGDSRELGWLNRSYRESRRRRRTRCKATGNSVWPAGTDNYIKKVPKLDELVAAFPADEAPEGLNTRAVVG